MPSADPCVACGARSLQPHLAVAAELDDQGLIPTTDQFGSALADIARCSACGHMQLDPMPSEAVLESSYAEAASGDYIEEETGQRSTARQALDDIERWAPGRHAILDLGCWVGFLLAEAQTAGWQECVGIEPSTFASAYARDELGLDVRTSDLFTADLPLEHFDAVVMGDVIEHLPRPGEALDRIADLLRPEGVLWLALPDAGSMVARVLGRRWWSILPTHVQYFTRTSLTKLLDAHGFEVRDLSTAPKVFTVSYYLSRVSGYSRPLGRALVGVARFVRIDNRLWGPDFRDRMAVVAQRRAVR